MGWANRITLARAVLTVLVWALVGLGEGRGPAWWHVTFAVFTLTAVTDMVDGALARRLGEVSVFGRIADPLVDKLLVLGTITALLPVPGVPQVLPVWVALVIVVRELLVTVLRSAVEAQGGNFQAAFWGKLKMISQCVLLGGVLEWQAGVPWVRAPIPALGGANVVLLLAWLAAGITLVSCLDYARRGWALLSAGGAAGPRR